MPPRIPTRIGRYDVLELLAKGGMGVLYRCRDGVLERDVAIKVMAVDFSNDAAARDRFEREAKAVARLQHRNVVTIHELGDHEGTPYIVMELLSGADLDAVIRSGQSLTLAGKLDIVIQICAGLRYAHDRGIVHRDIKPGNVRVLEDSTVKILDFGIAKFANNSITRSGTILGTAYYMAPEQILGQTVDGRADLFATGVLLHELVVGEKPFRGDSPTAVGYQVVHVDPPALRDRMPHLPGALNDIVAKALRKRPQDRFANAGEMLTGLQAVRDALGDSPPPSPQSSRASALTWPPALAGRLPQLAGLALIVAVTTGAYVATRQDAAAVPAADRSAAVVPTDADPPVTPTTARAAVRAPLTVTSAPPGARITLNGVDTGLVTPATVSLDAEATTVELTLKGYRPLTATLTAADAAAGSRELRLIREAGPVRLTVMAPFAFEVLQGTKVVSTTATSHELTVVPSGGLVSVRSTDVVLSTPLTIDYQRPQATITLPAPGTLAVFAALETCAVVVDGHDLGFPPIARKSIAAGNHTVVLRCPNGTEDSRRITITSGERTAVTFAR